MQPTAERVRQSVAALLRMPVERVTSDAELASLVTDSFALVEMSIALQEEFDVFFRQADLVRVVTVGDVIDLVVSRAASGAAS